jgi:hypothetical protein
MDELIVTNYQDLVDFICEQDGYFSFVHTTNTEEKAKSICENGFRYKKFDKTADYVCDRVTLEYMLAIRKHYGDFIIIILISRRITNYDALCQMEFDEENEEIFTLPHQFIKGYYNRITNELYKNPFYVK